MAYRVKWELYSRVERANVTNERLTDTEGEAIELVRNLIKFIGVAPESVTVEEVADRPEDCALCCLPIEASEPVRRDSEGKLAHRQCVEMEAD